MKKIIIAALALTPMLASAQQLTGIFDLVNSIGRLVNLAIPILIGIALLAFFWGLVKFIFAQGNEEAKGEGKQIMLWGIIALFVMVSVWGLVNFISTALNLSQSNVPQSGVPRVPQIGQ